MSQEYTEDKEVTLTKLSSGLRLLEALLILIVLFAVWLMAALLSFNPSDPSWSQTAWHEPIHNLGGMPGAWLADTLFFIFTCGVLSEDDTFGTITIAEPIGIICGIVPTTNPTSTAIFKSLISLKTRNAIIFSPHPRAKDATNKAADIVLQAAIAAGAPKDLIGWIDQPSVELSNALMHGYISALLRRGELEGKPGQTLLLHHVPNVLSERILLIGCGKERELDERQYKQVIQKTINTLNDTGSMESLARLSQTSPLG